MFNFSRIYYEIGIKKYKLGKYLLDKYKDLPMSVINNHNNILELRQRENKDFPVMKNYLIIGIRKTQKFVVNHKVSDYLVPYTSSGCSAYCLYCYLVCNYNKCSYLRLFVNREELLSKIIKKANESEKELVFEIGSNSDLLLENTITHNLEWTIVNFAKNNHGYLTFPTKFHFVDDILDLDHRGRIIVRISVNPEEIIRRVEFKTSSLEQRIEAINKLCDHNYKVGIIIAPVIMVDGYKELYIELIKKLNDKLSDKVKNEVFFEVIFMTYSFVHSKINEEAFPKAINLYSKDKMTGGGRGKYYYKKSLKEDGEIFIRELLNEYFPLNKILYIC